MAAVPDYDVMIVGGGPVGLLLGNLLGSHGLRTLLLEKNAAPPSRSMAIGVTPPSLEILRQLHLDEDFVRHGVRVDHAVVHENGRWVGELRFHSLPTPYPFILALPQSITISLLEERLQRQEGVSVRRATRLLAARQSEELITATLCADDGAAPRQVTASILVGCDGHQSLVRQIAGIRLIDEKIYPPHFLMADFSDHTDLGTTAHLFFSRHGSVESFPLPRRRRRWILQTERLTGPPALEFLVNSISRRTGYDLPRADASAVTAFAVRRFVCHSYFHERIVLCGDAAHVMSPVGGQGMNTGFADAHSLADCLARHLRHGEDLQPLLNGYDQCRRSAFSIAAARAERCMWLGTRRGRIASGLRYRLIKSVLTPHFNASLAACFAMLTIPGCPLRNTRQPATSSPEGPMNNWRQGLKIGRQIDTPEKKRRFNEQHFSAAASRYDLATRAMSLGRDQNWKKQLVKALPEMNRPRCVDLASGTGDIAFLLGARFPAGSVTGVDLTMDMVSLAERRNRYENVTFSCQDMAATNFADDSVDIVTGSYALRNAADLAAGLREVRRILKPGGTAAFLDFSRSRHGILQTVQYWLLKCWCGLWGTLLHANPTLHAYIADSLAQFPARDDYHRLLRRTGFELVSCRRFYCGMLELVVIRKNSAHPSRADEESPPSHSRACAGTITPRYKEL